MNSFFKEGGSVNANSHLCNICCLSRSQCFPYFKGQLGMRFKISLKIHFQVAYSDDFKLYHNHTVSFFSSNVAQLYLGGLLCVGFQYCSKPSSNIEQHWLFHPAAHQEQ